MANHGARVGSYSFDPIVWAVNNASWKRIENAYAQTLGENARQALIAVVEDYLHWRDAELNAPTLKVLEGELGELAKTAVAFRKLANYGGSESDVTSDLGSRLKRALAQNHAIIPARQVLALSDGEEEWAPAFDVNHEHLKILVNKSVLNSIARSVEFAIADVRKTIKHSRGFQPGDAFIAFIHSLEEWAEAFNLPHSSSKNDGTPDTPIERLLFEIDKLIPTKLREKHQSPKSIASRIFSARKIKRITRASLGANDPSSKG
jgi:hypothetical protein